MHTPDDTQDACAPAPEAGSASPSQLAVPTRHWYRLALVSSIVLVAAVVASLPLAVRSMQEVLGRSPEPLYNVLTGQEIAPGTAAAEQHATYFNLGMVDLDDSTGALSLAVSGNRRCTGPCPSLELHFFALDDDANERLGLPPSATVTLAPDDLVFSQTVQLPLRGKPSLYPFDTYEVWLGMGGVATMADGTTVNLTPDTVTKEAFVTLQNRIHDMIMTVPTPITPEAATAAADPLGFLAVLDLTFSRPAYMQVLAVVLILLIGVSATMALLTRDFKDLTLGIGGLILGIWGIRRILMPAGLSTLTVVDLALTWLILWLLLGLALRATLHFHRHSELPRPRLRRST